MNGKKAAGYACIGLGGWFAADGIVSTFVNTADIPVLGWNFGEIWGTNLTGIISDDAALNVGNLIQIILGIVLIAIGIVLLRSK